MPGSFDSVRWNAYVQEFWGMESEPMLMLTPRKKTSLPGTEWCLLGVVLPVFTRLGHECRNHVSPCDGTHVGKRVV